MSERRRSGGRIEENEAKEDRRTRCTQQCHLKEHTDSKHWCARTLPTLPARAPEMSRPSQ